MSTGTSRLVRYIEVYVIASYVIASQFSMVLMRCCFGGLSVSAIVRNSEVYVIIIEGRYIEVRPVVVVHVDSCCDA